MSTLKFAARAKHIRCAAKMNEEYSGTVESLMLEVKSLKQQLELLSSRGLCGITYASNICIHHHHLKDLYKMILNIYKPVQDDAIGWRSSARGAAYAIGT